MSKTKKILSILIWKLGAFDDVHVIKVNKKIRRKKSKRIYIIVSNYISKEIARTLNPLLNRLEYSEKKKKEYLKILYIYIV